MDFFKQWDFAESFSMEEMAALIGGIDPGMQDANGGIAEFYKVEPIFNRIHNAVYRDAISQKSDKFKLVTNLDGQSMGGEIGNGWDAPAIKRAEVVRWLSEIGLESVYQFDKSKPNANIWPWGAHQTKLLEHLDAAAKKFWLAYDPANAKATAPKNHEVIVWLKSERKVSDAMAKAIASMLRPHDLPTGPRK